MCRLPCSSLLPCGSRGYSRPREQPPPQNFTSPPIWRVRFLGICKLQYLRNMLYSEQESILFSCIFSPRWVWLNQFVTVCYVKNTSYLDVSAYLVHVIFGNFLIIAENIATIKIKKCWIDLSKKNPTPPQDSGNFQSSIKVTIDTF